MPRNPSLSFVATPDLKTQIESIAKASGSSRSKAIAGLVSKGLSEQTKPVVEDSGLLTEIELLNKALEDQANKANEAAQEIEALTAYYKAEIAKLQEQVPEVPKFESKLKQLESEKFFELLEFYRFSTEEEELFREEQEGAVACDLEEKEYWCKVCEEIFVANLARYQRFIGLADEVNEILWQIDNSCSLDVMFGDGAYWGYDIWAIASKLIEYGLLQPIPHTPCSPLELWQYLQEVKIHNNVLAVVTHAFENKRFDVIAAMLPWKPPIERGTYWHNYYSSCIGSEKAKGVWEWKGNPEAHQINDELSTVLTWEEPAFAVRWIIESLTEHISPFERTDIHWDKGEETKRYYRDSFTRWHSDRLQELGQERLERCYSVVFGIAWGDVDAIVNPIPSGAWYEVLGVSHTCSESDLKRAYREMAKRYHPDVNKSDAAKRAIQAINRAYEEGKAAIRSRTQYVGRTYSWHNDPRPEWQRCGYDSPEAYKEAEKRMEEELADIPF
jgi:hypothetical protein